MDEKQIIIRRTGMSNDDAEYYISLAKARIRGYLDLDDSADLSKYVFPIVDIAVLYWQMDTSTKASASSLGFTSKSVSEGGVSKSVSGMTGSAIYGDYEASIMEILLALDRRGGVGVNIF